MNTLAFIKDSFKIDPSDDSYPHRIPKSRWDIGLLINVLGFKKGAEVGVYKCIFTTSLARKAPNAEIIGIDAWTPYEGYKDDVENQLTDAEAVAIERTKNFPNIKLVKAWSLDAAKDIEDGSLDFVYIDANHDYEHCKEDLEAWSKKVRKGGLVMGHDYVVNEKQNVGVIKAVDEWIIKNNISDLFTWTDNTPSWMYVKQ